MLMAFSMAPAWALPVIELAKIGLMSKADAERTPGNTLTKQTSRANTKLALADLPVLIAVPIFFILSPFCQLVVQLAQWPPTRNSPRTVTAASAATRGQP